MAARAPQQRIDIGNVMSLGFRTLARNFLPFIAFALLLVGLPSFVVQYFTWEQLQSGEAPFLSFHYWGGAALSWIGAYLLQGIVVAIAVRDLDGEGGDLSDGVMSALARLLPMIALSIVSGIGILLGFVLLIVPGVILMLMWMVAVPVLVHERRGVFESLGRSAELTAGSKGWLFLLLLLYWGTSLMLSGAVAALTVAELSYDGRDAMLFPIVVGAVVQSLNGLLLAGLQAALYVELRQYKEGAAPGELAAIFE